MAELAQAGGCLLCCWARWRHAEPAPLCAGAVAAPWAVNPLAARWVLHGMEGTTGMSLRARIRKVTKGKFEAVHS